MKPLTTNLPESVFTPCQVPVSLLEAITEAAKNAISGDLVLFSPASPVFDQFRNEEQRDDSLCLAAKSIRRGALAGNPYMNGTITTA